MRVFGHTFNTLHSQIRICKTIQFVLRMLPGQLVSFNHEQRHVSFRSFFLSISVDQFLL